MSTPPVLRRSRRSLVLLSRVSFLLTGLVLVAGLGWLIGQAAGRGWTIGVGQVAAGMALYLLSQGARALRVATIVADPGLSVRRLAQAHIMGAGASFVLPFKLGEILRLGEIAHVVGSPWRAFMVLWIERVFDAFMMGILLALLWMTADGGATLGPIIGALILFVVLTVVVFFVLPENIDGLTLFIVRRYRGPTAARLLGGLDRLHGLIMDGRRMMHRKTQTLGALSVAIWALEAGIVALLLSAVPGAGNIGNTLAGLLTFLSGAVSGAGIVGGGDALLVGLAGDYVLVLGLPLLTIGVAGWLAHMVDGRLRQGAVQSWQTKQGWRG